MSGGRNKLGDFGQLKSLVSSSFKGLKEKTDKFRSKTEKSVAEEKNINSGHKSQQQRQGNSQQTNHKNAGRPQTRMEKASTQKNFHMPQFGQKMDIQADFDQMNSTQATAEEVVVTVDAKQQVQMDERRLFNWICKRFPKCFNPKMKKPLKIGISDEIELMFKNENQSDVDQMALRRVLRRYVGDQNYQRAILEHKARFDLNGNSVEDMTPEHLAHAEERLAELKEKAEFRKQGGTNLEFYEIKKKEKEEKEAKEAALKAEASALEEAQTEEVKTEQTEAAAEAVEKVSEVKEEVVIESASEAIAEEQVEVKPEEKLEDVVESKSVDVEKKDNTEEAK